MVWTENPRKRTGADMATSKRAVKEANTQSKKGEHSKETKKTAGEQILENNAKDHPKDVSAYEYGKEVNKGIIDKVWETIDEHKKKFCSKFGYTGPFFVVLLIKKDPLFANTVRHCYLARISCPTPCYSQTVLRYDPKDDAIDLVWTLLTEEQCKMMVMSPPPIKSEDYALYQMAKSLYNGDLLRLAYAYDAQTPSFDKIDQKKKTERVGLEQLS